MFKWISEVKAAFARLAASVNSLADQVDEARELLANGKEQPATPALENKQEENDPLAIIESKTNSRKRVAKS